MGLLDQMFGMGADDPKSQAMAALSAGLLQGNLGGGLLGASSAFAQQKAQALKQQMAQMQMEQHRMQMEDAQRARQQEQQVQQAAQAAWMSPERASQMNMGPMADGSMPNHQPGFDQKRFINSLYPIAPMKAMEWEQKLAKDDSPLTVAPGASLVDRKTMRPVFTAPASDSVPSAVKEYQFAKNEGYQGTFEQWDRERKKAGASVTSVRVENKMGDSLAKEIGPILNDSSAAATGAANQIDAANRIVKAIDSNNVFAGPGASLRLRGAQLGDMLGVAGKDAGEKIANTRSVVRGLAEMTLQGRKQMRGQGAVTESESKLAERAISGDIDDLTAGEIKMLANASARSAKFVYAEHQKKLNVVRGNPAMSNLAPFYEAQPMPEEPKAGGAADYVWQNGKLIKR
jgi:hypothetical protein